MLTMMGGGPDDHAGHDHAGHDDHGSEHPSTFPEATPPNHEHHT